MNTEVLAWLSFAASTISLIGLIYTVVFRQAKLESRVEILWDFLVRRGITEAMQRGLLERNSPFRLTIDIRGRYKPLFDGVMEYYNRDGSKLKDSDLVSEIEKHFWPQIKQVCVDQGINDGACLAMILHYIRPEASYFKEWDVAHG